MPELPEVYTTVSGLSVVLPGQIITNVWSDVHKNSKVTGSRTLKSPHFKKEFTRAVVGKRISDVSRRGKNIIITLEKGPDILIHMKMTGHLLYGTYRYDKKGDRWEATESGPLKEDPFNQHVHVIFTLDSGKHLAFSDLRKFGTVTFATKDTLEKLGPEPLNRLFTFKLFRERLQRKPGGRIKQVLMDQTVLVGIGNIYSDEMLWRAGIHPTSVVSHIPTEALQKLYRTLKTTLKRGIALGGDSTSDYRTVDGSRGSFQSKHRAYQKTGQSCEKRGCGGTINRIVVGGRSAHFCDTHQTKY